MLSANNILAKRPPSLEDDEIDPYEEDGDPYEEDCDPYEEDCDPYEDDGLSQPFAPLDPDEESQDDENVLDPFELESPY